MRQSRPDFGLGVKAKVFKSFQVLHVRSAAASTAVSSITKIKNKLTEFLKELTLAK
jgi:hypothetical protein